jgi:hypothetical protein
MQMEEVNKNRYKLSKFYQDLMKLQEKLGT